MPDRTRETPTKQAAVADMLRRPEGATLAEIAAKTGWKPNTIRVALYGALKTRLGLTVTAQIDPARGRVYSLPARR